MKPPSIDRKTARFQAPRIVGTSVLFLLWGLFVYPNAGWYTTILYICAGIHLAMALRYYVYASSSVYPEARIANVSWWDRLKLRFAYAQAGVCTKDHGTVTTLHTLEARYRSMHGKVRDEVLNSYSIEKLPCNCDNPFYISPEKLKEMDEIRQMEAMSDEHLAGLIEGMGGSFKRVNGRRVVSNVTFDGGDTTSMEALRALGIQSTRVGGNGALDQRFGSSTLEALTKFQEVEPFKSEN